MRVLVSEKLSPHRFKTPEGYLICTDAILARTGKQTYRRREVFGDMSDKGEEEIEINRDAKEVFDPATLASFENKPLTIEHPNEDVNPENHHDYAVGFTRDIKRGKTTNGEDVMLGTIVVTDAEAIKDIESGELVELSCGYDCDVVDEANPQQRNIRGNHVALCERGRAGIARIVDSKTKDAVIKTIDLKESKHRGDIGSIKLNLINANECWISIEGLYEDDTSGLINIFGRTACVKVKKDDQLTVNIYYAISSNKLNRLNRTDVNIETTKASWKEDVIRYIEQTYSKALYSVRAKDSVDSKINDVNDLTKFKTALRNISKMYSNDPGIEYVTSVLRNLGYEVTVDSIDGWKENRNVPGEHIKKYRMNVTLEGKEHHFLVELYADMGEWKVKEINAYMLDSNNIKQGDSMKDTKLQDKYVLYQQAGVWYGTKQENYEARIQNANAIQSFKAFNSVDDIIEYLSKYGHISKADIIVKDSVKDEDFSKKTKQGFTVVEMYRDGGRLHAIVKRSSDYVVALGYDTSDGTWAQGRYVDTYGNALATLLEEKPSAKKIQDAVKDAKTEYVFNWHDTYHGTKDKTRVDANNIKEAIRKFGDIIGLGGIGTANCYVISISPNDGYLSAYGRLSALLRTFKDCETKDAKDRFYTIGTKLKNGNNVLTVVKVDDNYVYLKHPDGKVYAYNAYDLSQNLEMSPKWSYVDSTDDSLDDSCKKFAVKYTKDSKTYIQIVKASDLTDAVKKVKVKSQDVNAVPFASQSEVEAAMREIEPLYERVYHRAMHASVVPWRYGYKIAWERSIPYPFELQHLVGDKYVLSSLGAYKGKYL